MTGWLIVNEFLNTEKFIELQSLFMDAAHKKNVTLVKYTNADFLVSADTGDIVSKAFLNERPEFVIFYDKDIALAKALEKKGLKLFNSAESISACDSKYETSVKIASFNCQAVQNENGLAQKICIPRTFKVPFTYENIGMKGNGVTRFLELMEKKIDYPVIIKESYSSFGMGVHLAKNRSEAMNILSECGRRECLIQEYIETESGDGTGNAGNSDSSLDVRIQMVGHECVASMMRSNPSDFRANITNGGVMSQYSPTEQDIALSVNVMDALGLDFAGIDIIHTPDGKAVFCEANSNAHFKNLFDLTGINTAEYMLDYIENKISRDNN